MESLGAWCAVPLQIQSSESPRRSVNNRRVYPLGYPAVLRAETWLDWA